MSGLRLSKTKAAVDKYDWTINMNCEYRCNPDDTQTKIAPCIPKPEFTDEHHKTECSKCKSAPSD